MADAIQRKIDRISENAFRGISSEKQEDFSQIIQKMVRNISE
jgi:hypothetical protein